MIEKGFWTFDALLPLRIQSYIDFLYYLSGLIIVLKHLVKSLPYYKEKSLIIVGSITIPSLLCIPYYHTALYPQLNYFDLATISFLIPLTFISYGLLKYNFLNITPLAFPQMADDLKESILIVDAEGMIAYYNRAFQDNFTNSSFLSIDNRVKSFTDYIKKQINPNSEFLNTNPDTLQPGMQIIQAIANLSPIKISGELILSQLGKYFTVDIQPLFLKNDFIGQIITFYNITDYKKLLAEVRQKNIELEAANLQLKEYAATAEELAIARERSRFAGELHDSLGHTLTVIISLLGVCTLACDKDIDIVKQKLNEMMKFALKGHQELKHSIQGMIPENQAIPGIISSIQSLVKNFKKPE